MDNSSTATNLHIFCLIPLKLIHVVGLICPMILPAPSCQQLTALCRLSVHCQSILNQQCRHIFPCLVRRSDHYASSAKKSRSTRLLTDGLEGKERPNYFYACLTYLWTRVLFAASKNWCPQSTNQRPHSGHAVSHHAM